MTDGALPEVQETEEGRIQAPVKEKGRTAFGIGLRFSPGNIIVAAAILAGSILLYLFSPQLIWEDPPTGRLPILVRDVALFGGILLATLAFCFLEIRLPKALKAGLGWGMLLAMPILGFLAVDIINESNITTFTGLQLAANYLVYLMVFALVYAISRRVWITALAGGGVILLFGIANYFTASFRGAPILPWDLQTLGTAADVMGNYTYTITRPMALSLQLFALSVLFCLRLCPAGKEKPSKGVRIGERIGGLIVATVLFVLIFPVNLFSNMDISVWAWNQLVSSRYTGIGAGFCANVQFMMVDKPAGYSAQTVAELGETIGDLPTPALLGTPEKQPTILVVMNESMTDLERTSNGSVTFSQDNMPFIHSLQESGSVIWGTAYSSVYGGNTCNSEYEFLSANTTAFLPTGSKPYQQYVDRDQTALPSILEDYGYNSLAIHPGNEGAWQRNTAYPFFGFDDFIHIKAFDVPKVRERNLVSDACNYEQVIYSYENRDKEKPLFLFNVTIQNHGGFTEENYPATVQVEEAPGKYPETEQYLSLTKKSDEAFETLLDYFSEEEEPVVVLFFGDHWPNLETDFLSQLLDTDARNPSFDDVMREREVPFLLWANYPIEGGQIEKISLNYLSGLLMRAAGLEPTAYQKYVEYVRETIPVITADGILDKDGIWYEIGEETPYDDLLSSYAVLQYNNAFGDKEKQMELFTPANGGEE